MRSPCLICDSTIVVHVISGTESAVVKIDFHQAAASLCRRIRSRLHGWVNMDLKSNFHNFKYEK
jgi:hypothetical protein